MLFIHFTIQNDESSSVRVKLLEVLKIPRRCGCREYDRCCTRIQAQPASRNKLFSTPHLPRRTPPWVFKAHDTEQAAEIPTYSALSGPKVLYMD